MWGMGQRKIFWLLDQSLLLVMVVISGVASVFDEDVDKSYVATKVSFLYTWGFLVLSGVLGIV